jgi:hypothetical protein
MKKWSMLCSFKKNLESRDNINGLFLFDTIYFMTLTTHALVGASAAVIFPETPALAFISGFISHLLIDTQPHWGYKLFSYEKENNDPMTARMPFGRNFIKDLFRTGMDAILGMMLSIAVFSYLIFKAPMITVAIGAIGGLMPDFLQLVYFKTRSKILEPLQRFHVWIQENKELENISPLIGISAQAILVIAVISTLKIFYS